MVQFTDICRLRTVSVALCIACAVISYGAPSAGEEPADDTKVLQRILDDWQGRHDRIHTARFELEGEIVMPKGAYNDNPSLPPGTTGDVPDRDLAHSVREEWAFDFQRNLMRLSSKGAVMSLSSDALGKLLPEEHTLVFDGKHARLHDQVKASAPFADFHIVDDWTKVVNTGSIPLLAACGSFAHRDRTRRLKVPPDRAAFTVHARGVLQDVPCVVVRQRGSVGAAYDEYWVDLSRGSAILRWTLHTGERPFCRVDVHYEQRAGEWLPSRMEYIAWSGRDTISHTKRFTIVKAEFNRALPEDLFRLEPPVGAEVVDLVERRHYTVAEAGATHNWIPAWWLAGLVLIVVGLIWGIRRRRRAANAS